MFPRVVQYGDGREDAETRTRTRTGTSDADDSAAPSAGLAAAQSERLPAPLQYRDPARYDIVAEHGRGGLGRVFRARDKELGRDVALKELLSRGSTSELRFFREALITARLEHPGIVPVHEAGRWPDGTPFYAMKLVAGRPLKALIDDCKTLEDRLALLPHVIAVADAIAYAHDRKIIHRDLKPSNIIVGDFGETVVIDWGLAKDISAQAPAEDPIEDGPFRTAAAAGAGAGEGVTVAGSIVGTPAYMSPEQSRGEPVDERTDVFALGVLLSQLLKQPHPHHDTRQTQRPSAALEAVVSKATASDVRDRYSSAREFADEIRRYITKRPLASYRYSLLERSLLWLSARRGAALATAGSLIALLIIATTAAVLISKQEHATARSAANAEARVDELTLARASDWLPKDPRLALSFLTKYRGRDRRWQHAAALAADALSRGYATHLLSGHLGRITALVANEAGDGALSTSTDGSVIRWTVHAEGVTATRVCSGAGEPSAISFTATSARVVAAKNSGGIVICNGHSGVSKDLALTFTPLTLRVSPMGTSVAALGATSELAVVDLASESIRWQVILDSTATFAAFAGDDTLLVGTHSQLMALDANNGHLTGTIPLPHGDIVASAPIPQGLVLLAANGCLLPFNHAWSHPTRGRWICNSDPLSTAAVDPARSLTGTLGSIAVSPSGDRYSFSLREGTWTHSVHSQGFTRESLPLDVTWLGYSPDAEHLYSTHNSGDVFWLSPGTGSTGRFAGHGEFVLAGAFLRIGNSWRLVSAGADSELRLWSRPAIGDRSFTSSVLYNVIFSRPLNAFVTDGQDGTLRKWGQRDSQASAWMPSDGSIAHGCGSIVSARSSMIPAG